MIAFQISQYNRGYNARMTTPTPEPTSTLPGSEPLPRARKRLKPRLYSWTELLTLPVLFFLGLGLGWLIWGQNTSAPAPITGEVRRFEVPIDDDPIFGPADAPVTIIEFSDYQCPYCARWHTEVFSRLMTAYEGKVRFIYRDFPLYSIHPQAEAAAEAANCAGEQNAYWDYHTALFSEKYSLGAEGFRQYAAELGLDTVKFGQCLDEHRYQAEVKADFDAAVALGVSSTPTFFINGRALIGAQGFEAFQQIINEELAGQ